MTPLVVSRVGQLDPVRDALRGAPYAAIDTEFLTDRTHTPQLMWVQIHVPERGVFLVDALEAGLLRTLGPDLCAVPWLVHGSAWDLRLLREAIGTVSTTVRDTQIGAALVGPRYPAGLGWLASTWLGRDIDKGEALSDWGRRPLSPSQLAYAANDVLLLPELWKAITDRIDATGRTPCLAPAHDEFIADTLAPSRPEDAWTSVGGADVLEGLDLARVVSVARWRHQVADVAGTTPRAILQDALLLTVAKRGLHAAGRALRNLDRDRLAGLEAALAAADPASNPPSFPHGSAARRRLALVHAFAEAAAHELGVAATFALPDVLRRRLAAEAPDDEAALLRILGWRAHLLGDLFSDLALGRRVLVPHAGGAIVIENRPISG